MAEQEEPKNAAPGQAPTPIKLHKSGLAGTTQHLSHPVDTADRTATVPIAKVSVGGKPMPKPSPSAVPPGAAGEAAEEAAENEEAVEIVESEKEAIEEADKAKAETKEAAPAA